MEKERIAFIDRTAGAKRTAGEKRDRERAIRGKDGPRERDSAPDIPVYISKPTLGPEETPIESETQRHRDDLDMKYEIRDGAREHT